MAQASASRVTATALLAAAIVTCTTAHGFCSQPRVRGAIYTQRPVGNLAGENDVKNAWSYCPHCQNGGGTDRLRNIGGNVVNNFFQPFKPMEGKFRNGVSMCGDPDGNNDHSANGRYKAPSWMPYVAEYQAGGTADFEYDVTTPHGGYLQFFLCDVSQEGDLTQNTFRSGRCHLLNRASVSSCESGQDSSCGPIDPNHPSRYYLPCRVSDSRDQDQILGGKSGKMKYKIPNVAMSKAVIMSYWLTGNNCNADGLKEYFTSGKWGAVQNSYCPGDGGTVGGYRADHTGTCTTQQGKFPEEFWNCADVKVNGGGSGGGYVQVTQQKQQPEQTNGQEPQKLEQEQEQQQQTYEPPQQQSQQSWGHQGGKNTRPGCMPKFNEARKNDRGYLSYWAQLENYCSR